MVLRKNFFQKVGTPFLVFTYVYNPLRKIYLILKPQENV